MKAHAETPFTDHPFELVAVMRYVFDEYTEERFEDAEHVAKRPDATPDTDVK
jgi:hypothetical protein